MSFSALLSACLLLLSPQFNLSDLSSGSPVSVKQSVKQTSDTLSVSFDVTISNGWHVYSVTVPEGGPTRASVRYDSISGASPLGPLRFKGDEKTMYDKVFEMEVSYFEKKVIFTQDFRLTAPVWHIEGALAFGACNNESCLPPQYSEFTFSSEPVANLSEANDNYTDLSSLEGYDEQQWEPVTYSSGNGVSTKGIGLTRLFFTSFLGGLIALLTPCVWPIIPMTVSFFMKRAKDRKSEIRDAVLYGFSIIIVYVTLALTITLIFGANALNSLATNSIVNIAFFLILVVFALALFGLFDFTLPASWSTGTGRRAMSGGFGGIFFMALTLTIVSFSCTGPIIGFLLVDAASTGSILAPTVGMLGFSLALAIPFVLFAMFPGWLQSIPKSGGWMEKVKVTLGFIELAFALKFLSVADMAYGWGILPRDLFIILWIIIAILLGLYLIGVLNFKKGVKRSKPGIAATVSAILCFAFAAWLVPGLWGAPLKAISAFTPPMSTQIFGKKDNRFDPQFTDYSEALESASRNGRPVLVDFTGYGCVNCRKMETALRNDTRVAKKISDNFIQVSLFVDDKTSLDKPVTVNIDGTRVKIRTVGDKWSLLQRHKFGANAQPFYVVIDAKGNLKAGPYTFNPDVESFLEFLDSGLL
ncbi:MAG: thiol:disulfide interchange protein [Bacteroidales bacterium]|nr:thiol:disulfide interchange protein [Bacteroidales bacterium]